MAATTETPPVTSVKSEPEHKPYVPDEARMAEFTFPAVLVGAILGIIFGASSLYLVLKVGLTVSASIPVAVLSITLFRAFSKLGIRATILENNIVQTTGSAGESIAFGIGVTMPALMLLGFEMDIGRVMVVACLGGLLGILMMIPLRRAFVVKQHGSLKYPEGTACAEVLIVGEEGGSSAKTVFTGFGIAFVYYFLNTGLKLWKDVASTTLSWFKGAIPAIEVNPALLGVGYIIGTKISCIMAAGGVLSSFVLIPAIRLFGDGVGSPIFPGTTLIKNMDEDQIWHDYVLYIGAGAVAAGGIISLFQALPLIASSLAAGLKDITTTRQKGATSRRTDRDVPLFVVGLGTLALVGAIWATEPLHRAISWVPDLHMNPLGALLIVVFGFLFVTVSSRITGEIGSSSNPISGMTVATLLLTCLIFLLVGWDKPQDRLTALSVAGVVCVAASNGGTTSQDLKTGFLVGATPKWQQISILVGSLSSAVVIGWILIMLNNANTIYSAKDLPTPKAPIDVSQLKETDSNAGDGVTYHVWRAPDKNPQKVNQGKYLVDDQGNIRYLVDPGINGKRTHRDDGTDVTRFRAPKATLMAMITNGILQRDLPWSLVLLGVSIAIVLELCGVPSLPFAVGVYLPLSSSTPIFVGGLVRYAAEKYAKRSQGAAYSEADSDSSPGVLLSTGYIAGGAIAGVVIAFLSFNESIPKSLAKWQYTHVTLDKPMTLKEASLQQAILEVGNPADIRPEDTHTSEDKEKLQAAKDKLQADVGKEASEIEDLNANDLPKYVRVPAGTVLNLPGNKTERIETEASLGDVASKILGTDDKAQRLLDLNQDKLKLPEALPADTDIKLPQKTMPAVYAFAALTGLLLLVGMGLIMKAPPGGRSRTQASGNGNSEYITDQLA